MTTWSILHRDSCPCREKGCPVDARRDPCWTKGCVLVEVLDAPKGTVVEDLTVTPVEEDDRDDVDEHGSDGSLR